MRRNRTLAITLAVSGAALTGVLLWWLLPAPGDSGGETPDPGARSSQSGAPTEPGPGTANQPSAPTSADLPEKVDLLTPDGIRQAIDKLRPVMGGSQVIQLVVYPEHISAEALVKGSSKKYDRFTYRGGESATREGAGGTKSDPATPVDLNGFDWDAVPGLLRTADRTLGVEHPTSRYLVVSPASQAFNDGPTMSVYLSDAYGSGYLKASPQGKVLSTSPQED
ncbi:hypothetical protein AAHZ94_10385 [Streptomyces sp. HSW2009]|uniref:hypothetical protein n=1 Tax=Streptomyces sp. HSW2009 TaxID=3142890 RepID=UPI0032ED134E